MQLRVGRNLDVGHLERPRDSLKRREAEIAALGADADERIAEDVFLRLADLVVAVVVDDEEFDGQPIRDDGLQFLQVHHDAAVALKADDALAARDGGADGSGQAVAHRRDAAVHEEAAALLDEVRLAADDARRPVGDDRDAALGQSAAQSIHESIDVRLARRFLLLGPHDGVLALPPAALREPCPVFLRLILLRRREKRTHEVRRIGTHGIVDADRRLFQFGGVDVVDDRICRTRPETHVVADLVDAQATADREQQVAVLHGEVARAVAHRAAPAAVVRMPRRDEVDAVPACDDRH